MKFLIDTNIVLDVILRRQSFYNDSVEALGLAKKDMVEEFCISRNEYLLLVMPPVEKQDAGKGAIVGYKVDETGSPLSLDNG